MKKQLADFLNPKSIAVVGASLDEKKLGAQILKNIISGGYRGKVYPINPAGGTIQNLKAFASVLDVKKNIDMAVIVIPAIFVAKELENCAKAGIKNLVIISAGFSEEGSEGKARELEIASIANKYGLNILGPNCLGFINSSLKLNATFADSSVKPGKIAFVSQSGAVCSAALDWAQSEGAGFSYFLSTGNTAVLDESDFFGFLAEDDKTELVIAYLEEIIDGKKFMRAASELTKKKMLAILKAGQSDAGRQAALSHTGSLAGSSEAFLAAARRSGAIILDGMDDVFSLLEICSSNLPLSEFKPNSLIISNAGGPGVALTDQMEKIGAKLEKIPPALYKALKINLPELKNINNPLDLIGDAPAARYDKALATILNGKINSNLIILLTPQSSTEPELTAQIIAKAFKKYRAPIVTSFMGGEAVLSARKILKDALVPHFIYPGQLARAIALVGQWNENKKKIKIYNYTDKPEEVFTGQPILLDYLEGFKIIKNSGLNTVENILIKSKDDLRGIAYPIVLKVVGKNLSHKTDKGGIAVNLKNIFEAEIAFSSFSSLLEDKDNCCLAQKMIPGGFEIILGMKRDPFFGPIIMVGAGGIYAEVFKDIQLEVGDVDISRALEMIKKLRCYPILSGARGKKALDIESLARAIVLLAQLAEENPRFSEIDLNPVFILEEGVVAADARIISY